MKKLVLSFLSVAALVGCDSSFTVKDFKVSTKEDRIILKNLAPIEIRPSDGSPNFNSSLPEFENIASVMSPTSLSSTGDVQATALALEGNYLYIAYNMAGPEVFGAIDIINVADPAFPVIDFTYATDVYEFSDIKVKNNKLYLSGQKKDVGAIMMVVDASTKTMPVIRNVTELNGLYGTSISLLNNIATLSSGDLGGLHKLNVANITNPALLSNETQMNSLYVHSSSLFDFSLSGLNSFANTIFKAGGVGAASGRDSAFVIPGGRSYAPSRFFVQNSLVYLNNSNSERLHVLDISHALKSSISQISTVLVPGTANGLSHDQQRVYLAQGEEGFYVVDASDPSQPSMLGTFAFPGENGSANNIWIQSNVSNKFLFLAHGRQGLRILRESDTPKVASNKIQFYARGMDYMGSAEVKVRVNGIEIATVQLDGSEYQLYTVTHSAPLSPTDVVEVVYSNDLNNGGFDSDRNAMVAFVKVNDNYCYIKPLSASGSDLGLLDPNQTIAVSQNSCQTTNGPSITPVCLPSTTQSCSIANGSGYQTCNANGSGYGSCVADSCNAGFYLAGNVCLPQSCSPNSTQSCSIANGTGAQTCNSQGSGYGSCQLTSCNSGYYNNGGVCTAQTCSPNSTSSCVIPNGTGNQVCNAQGTAYGACQLTSCNSGYYNDNGTCVALTCSPNSTASCSVPNGTGNKVCNAQGTAYGSCQLTSCNSGFYNNGGSCVAQTCTPNSTSSCSVPNGTGNQVCNAQGSAYGSCSLTSCNSGFYNNGGSCVAQVCSPNSTASCSIANGTGAKTCNSTGSAYGSCQLTSCNAGYYNNGGSCSPQVCTPNSSNACTVNNFAGTQVCNSNGSSLSACVSSGSCISGYYLSGGSCVPQACTPNSTQSCSIANGSGSQTCNSQGSAYGSCQLTSCNAGYTNVSGSCVAQVCSPNSTSSCSVANGSGTQTCNSNGTAQGSCVANSCNSGYTLSGGQCVVNNACSVPNGSGQTTTITNSSIQISHQLNNDWGAGYSYQLRLDNSGSSQIQDWSICFNYNYNVGNSSAVSNADIDPSSAKPLWKFVPKSYNKIIYPGSNVTMNWNGSPGNVGQDRLTNIKVFNRSDALCTDTPVYASGPVCVATSCNQGYHLKNGSCISDVRTCSASGGTGIQHWNGSVWGPCEQIVCNSSKALINVNLLGQQPQSCATSCPVGLIQITILGSRVCL